jgi:soluble lytic murein transglycosylase-like protein
MDALIARYAAEYGVPEALVHRVVKRESTYNPQARNGGHYGLMQIKPETARTMGYRGDAAGLYDAETNLKYGVKYLRGAWLLADGSHDRAVQLYCVGLLLRGGARTGAACSRRNRPFCGSAPVNAVFAHSASRSPPPSRWPGL